MVGPRNQPATPSGPEGGMFGSAVPFITPGDLEKETANSARFLTEAGAARVGTVRAGKTFVCCIGATIGKTDKTRIRSSLNRQINAIEWDSSVDNDFGLYLMRLFTSRRPAWPLHHTADSEEVFLRRHQCSRAAEEASATFRDAGKAA